MGYIELWSAWILATMLLTPVVCGSLAHYQVMPRVARQVTTYRIVQVIARGFARLKPVLYRWQTRVMRAMCQIGIILAMTPMYLLPGLPLNGMLQLEGPWRGFEVNVALGAMLVIAIVTERAASWLRCRELEVPTAMWPVYLMLGQAASQVVLLVWPVVKDVPLY